MWKNKKAYCSNSPIMCSLSNNSTPFLPQDWLSLACWREGIMRSTMQTRGIFLRRIDAAIMSFISVQTVKCTKCARVWEKRHYGQSGGNTWRPVNDKKYKWKQSTTLLNFHTQTPHFTPLPHPQNHHTLKTTVKIVPLSEGLHRPKNGWRFLIIAFCIHKPTS